MVRLPKNGACHRFEGACSAAVAAGTRLEDQELALILFELDHRDVADGDGGAVNRHVLLRSGKGPTWRIQRVFCRVRRGSALGAALEQGCIRRSTEASVGRSQREVSGRASLGVAPMTG